MHDVAVIGAGPAGIAAAVTAADAGASVLLVDGAVRPGGQIWRHIARHTLPPIARTWLQRLDGARVTQRLGTSVIDAERAADSFTLHLSADDAGSMESVRTVIIATGARELFLPFPGWTLPGVMGAGGAQALLKAGADMRGRRIVIAGSGPLLLAVAATLAGSGASVTDVFEQSPPGRVALFAAGLWRTPGRLLQAAALRVQSIRTRYHNGAWVTTAHGTDRLTSVTVTDGMRSRTVQCDLLCTGYGLVPATELAELLGCDIDGGAVRTDSMQATSVPGVYCAGESAGIGGVEAALLEGRIAAHAAVGARSATITELQRAASAERAFAGRVAHAFALRPELLQLAADDTLVCRCEDVSLRDVARCASMREAKLHTRAGMGPCQGRVCGPALEQLFGWPRSSVRPPLFPADITSIIENNDSAVAEGAA